MIKIVIFASGSGTNAENIIRYFQATKSASVEAVFTNKADAQVIQRAEKYQVPSQVFTKNDLEAGKVLFNCFGGIFIKISRIDCSGVSRQNNQYSSSIIT